MIKSFVIFGLCIASTMVFADEFIQEIYSQAEELSRLHGDDKDEPLFRFYTDAIDKINPSILQKNPELVFRKSLAEFNTINNQESLQEAQMKFPMVRQDLEFVMRYVPQNSLLFKAAKYRKEFIDAFLHANPQSMEEGLIVGRQFMDHFLREWAPGSSASGKALREEVVRHFQKSKEARNAFLNAVLILEDDLDITLGRRVPQHAKVIGIMTDADDGVSYLNYQWSYRDPEGHLITITNQI